VGTGFRGEETCRQGANLRWVPAGRTTEERRSELERTPLADRLRGAFLKPVEPGPSAGAAGRSEGASIAELEDRVRFADDKERLIGLIAAPIAAAVGLLVIGALIANDPAALLRNGHVNKLHVSVSLYETLAGVLLGMSVLMLVMAWLRKRLYLGILTALYGLAIFNLHYWGFGIPFILAGAWFLVRAYRAQRDLREAAPADRSGPPGRNGATRVSRPQPRKRFTPPASSAGR